MIPFLAQQSGLSIPTPPTTSDPVTWIALAVVVAMILGGLFGLPKLLRSHREEREAADIRCSQENAAALSAFRSEMATERASHEATTNRAFDKMDDLAETTQELSKNVAALVAATLAQ